VLRVSFITPPAADADILAWAARESRILVSHGSDFTDLIFPDGAVPPPSVIYLRYEPTNPDLLTARIAACSTGTG
jgi:predicted nuclease of predicted toxin-antitoxin system